MLVTESVRSVKAGRSAQRPHPEKTAVQTKVAVANQSAFT